MKLSKAQWDELKVAVDKKFGDTVDPIEIVAWAGVAGIAFLILKQQQSNAAFSAFMGSMGATDSSSTDSPSIVPVAQGDTSSGGVSTMKSISDWATAMFGVEGNAPGSVASRNNNPGNLKFAGQANATAGPGGFAVFPSLDLGFQALYNQLNKTLGEQPGLTFQQFYARYLGQTDYLTPKVTAQGDPFAYAATVAGKLGVQPTDTIGSVFGGG